jgi:excisionase family DNA binding protein
MTAELRAALKTLAASVPAGAAVTITVPADQLLALLEVEPSTSAPAAGTEPQLLTVEEVAARLNVGTQWVYRRASRWSFHRRLGRAIRFDDAGFERWLARRTTAGGAP